MAWVGRADGEQVGASFLPVGCGRFGSGRAGVVRVAVVAVMGRSLLPTAAPNRRPDRRCAGGSRCRAIGGR